jgi:DNA-binding MarR family transcriptional regulator
VDARRDRRSRALPVAAVSTRYRITAAGREAFELSFEYFREHRAHMRRLETELGLPPMQMHALRALELGQPSPSATLARRLHCDPANATSVIDKLESLGLVERLVDPIDRRVKHVALTRKGAEMRARVVAALAAPMPLLGGLAPEEQEQLRDLFRKIVGGPAPPARDRRTKSR